MKKGKIKLTMDCPPDTTVEVEASIMSDQWAIHKEASSSLYVLTHIPSGRRAWSSRTQLFLKRLVQEPEFLEPIDEKNLEQLKRLVQAIKRFCDENTDLDSPKKKSGWE